jgi:hypothetical protein
MALKYLTGNYANTFQLMRAGSVRDIGKEAIASTQEQENYLDYYSQLLSTQPNGYPDEVRSLLIKEHLQKENNKLLNSILGISKDIPKDDLSQSKFIEDLKKLSYSIVDNKPNDFDGKLNDLIFRYGKIINMSNQVVNSYRATHPGENNDEQVKQYAFNYYLAKYNNDKIEDNKYKSFRDSIIPLGLFIFSIILGIAIAQPVGIFDFSSTTEKVFGIAHQAYGIGFTVLSGVATLGSVGINRYLAKKRTNAKFAKKTAYQNTDSVPDLVKKIYGQRLGAINPQKVFTNEGQSNILDMVSNYLVSNQSNSQTMRNFAVEANKRIRDEMEGNKTPLYNKIHEKVKEEYKTEIAQKTNELQRKLIKLQDEFYNKNLNKVPGGGFQFKDGGNTNAIIDPYLNSLLSLHEDHHNEVKQLRIKEVKELKKIDEVARKNQVPVAETHNQKDLKTAQQEIEQEYSTLTAKVSEIKEAIKLPNQALGNFSSYGINLVNSGYFPNFLLSQQAQILEGVRAQAQTNVTGNQEPGGGQDPAQTASPAGNASSDQHAGGVYPNQGPAGVVQGGGGGEAPDLARTADSVQAQLRLAVPALAHASGGAGSAPAPVRRDGPAQPGGDGVPAQAEQHQQARTVLAPSSAGGGVGPVRAATFGAFQGGGQHQAQPQQTCDAVFPYIYNFYKKIEELFNASKGGDNKFATEYFKSISSSPDLSFADSAFEKKALHSDPNAPHAPLYAILFLEECRDKPDLQACFYSLLVKDKVLQRSLHNALFETLETNPQNLRRIQAAVQPHNQQNIVYNIALSASQAYSSASRGPRVAPNIPREEEGVQRQSLVNQAHMAGSQPAQQIWDTIHARQIFDGLSKESVQAQQRTEGAPRPGPNQETRQLGPESDPRQHFQSFSFGGAPIPPQAASLPNLGGAPSNSAEPRRGPADPRNVGQEGQSLRGGADSSQAGRSAGT